MIFRCWNTITSGLNFSTPIEQSNPLFHPLDIDPLFLFRLLPPLLVVRLRQALRSSLQELNLNPIIRSETAQITGIEMAYGGQRCLATAKLCPSRRPEIQARYFL